MIEDELRRMNESFNLAKVFLALLALIKLFFGFMHFLLKANSKEVTKLLLTMILLSGMLLHSDFSSAATFKDVYSKQKGVQQQPNAFSFLSIPNFLDSNNLGAEMSANASKMVINSLNLASYHWLILVGVVSSICVHMISYSEYSKIGTFGLGIFYILYGVSILILSEFQRPWVHTLAVNNLIDSSTSNGAMIRILTVIAFLCMASGLSLLLKTKFIKIGKCFPYILLTFSVAVAVFL